MIKFKELPERGGKDYVKWSEAAIGILAG